MPDQRTLTELRARIVELEHSTAFNHNDCIVCDESRDELARLREREQMLDRYLGGHYNPDEDAIGHASELTAIRARIAELESTPTTQGTPCATSSSSSP